MLYGNCIRDHGGGGEKKINERHVLNHRFLGFLQAAGLDVFWNFVKKYRIVYMPNRGLVCRVKIIKYTNKASAGILIPFELEYQHIKVQSTHFLFNSVLIITTSMPSVWRSMILETKIHFYVMPTFIKTFLQNLQLQTALTNTLHSKQVNANFIHSANTVISQCCTSVGKAVCYVSAPFGRGAQLHLKTAKMRSCCVKRFTIFM